MSIDTSRVSGAANLNARDVLAAAWPLFQVSLPGCLPLAVLGVASSATPGAEAVTSGEARGLLHSGQWWGLYAASAVLMLICYAGILRQQLAFARGSRLGVLDSLRDSLRGLPATMAVVVVYLLSAFALVPLVLFVFAWLAQLDAGLAPAQALRRSVELVRGRFLAVAGVIGAAIAAVLVFVLLIGIFMAVIMNLAGQGVQPGATGLALSRWLMAAVLSLPVVYIGAVSAAAWRAASPSTPHTGENPST